MTVILFGSISTIADTSEIQRDSFNRAFAECGLDWSWDRSEYLELLQSSGGRDRIAAYAASRGETVDADEVHDVKSRLFREALGSGVPAREGVLDTITAARRDGHQLGFVTTTSPENVDAVLQAVDLDRGAFDLVLDGATVSESKPDPAAYQVALERLSASTDDAVAVEDNLGGLASARAAGVACVAFPNENTRTHDFTGATATVDRLELAELTSAAGR